MNDRDLSNGPPLSPYTNHSFSPFYGKKWLTYDKIALRRVRILKFSTVSAGGLVCFPFLLLFGVIGDFLRFKLTPPYPNPDLNLDHFTGFGAKRGLIYIDILAPSFRRLENGGRLLEYL